MRHYPHRVSPFGHRRIKAWLAAPRRFSQLPTSFVASCRLGIHRVPLVAWSSPLLVPDSGHAKTKIQSGRQTGSGCFSGVEGLQLLTSNSPTLSCAYSIIKDHESGADRVRTDDIQLAKLALSQLSYSPCPSPSFGGPG